MFQYNRELLPDDEWWKLKIAHSHYLTGEGAEELYDVCKELGEKYCTNVPPLAVRMA